MTQANGYIPAKIITREAAMENSNDSNVFRFPVEISSGSLDSYFTHMSEDTLRNYANDAAQGVPLLEAHDTSKLGIGYSASGELVKTEDGKTVVRADFYTKSGITFGGRHSYQSTDDFIKAVQAGLVRDVSVGFYGGEIICDICGQPVYGETRCPHFLGVEYVINGERVVATGEVRGAHLAEVSVVFRGANPDAKILEKFQRMARGGELTGKQLEKVTKTIFNRQGEDIMKIPEDIRALLPDDTQEDKQDEALVSLVRSQAAKVDELQTRIKELQEERKRLVVLADLGKAYRDDLIAQTIAEGVRANSDFPEETYRELLANSTIDQIKAIRESFATIANEKFAGKRVTIEDQSKTEDNKNQTVTAAYRV